MNNASLATCPLGPTFVVESDWESLESGSFRAHVQLAMWVLQSIITIDFGDGSKVTIGRDINGARLLEGGDGSSSMAVVSLLPLKKCLGMYKDASCDNSFGFSAVVTPALRAMPRFSCALTRGMPTPPPPQPPKPPPSPPPGFVIDPNLCYLGGTAHFVVAPHKVSSQAALQTWVVEVHLNTWLAGLRVVLDFPGVVYAEHGLHVHSVRPAEVARLVSVTRHSAIVELLATAARDFRFEALGDVEEIRVVCDVGDARPPPPLPPLPPSPPHYGQEDQYGEARQQGLVRGDASRSTQPVAQSAPQATTQPTVQPATAIHGGLHPPPMIKPPPPPPPDGPQESGPWGLVISVALLAFIGYHAKHMHNDVDPYMRQTAELVRAARTRATQTPGGRKLLAKVSMTSLGKMLFQLEARYLTLPAQRSVTDPEGGMKPPGMAVAVKPKPKAKGERKKAGGKMSSDDLEQEQPLVGHDEGSGDDDEDDAASEGDHGDEDVAEFGEPEQPVEPDEPEKVTTTVVIKVGQMTRKREVDLTEIADMAALQQSITHLCQRLNLDMKYGLKMHYLDADGKVHTVSRSTPIESICSAQELTLLPKAAPEGSKHESKGGQRLGSARNPSRRVPMPMDISME